MQVVFHEDFYRVYTGDPAAAAGRLEAVVRTIAPRVTFIEAEPATELQLARIHGAQHIQRVRDEGLFEIAALAAGGAIKAAGIGLSQPCFGLVRPPGHHASADSAWGFCFFNNMAAAIEAARHERGVERAYVLDIDLHFGDGTVNLLGSRPDVAVYNVGAHDRYAYLEEVAREMENCRAQLIAISAGFDNHREDWGGLLTTDDYRRIGEHVRRAAVRNGGGCFGILEGGYNHAVLGDNVLALLEGLSAA
jgi:acetoin utilization deacetylase AcuC-like enzyme